jgi:exopolysaccharide biosynthesis polyprenyl glycosylphosphotransferase
VVGKPTLIVGAGQVGAQVERRLEEQPELGLDPVGYLDADPPPESVVPARRAGVLGPPSELAAIAQEHGVQHVILAFMSAPDHVLIPIVRDCEARGLEVSLVPRLFESVNVRVGLEHIGGLPLFGLRSIDPKSWQFVVKHAFDRVGAALLIVFFAPVLLGAAIAVKLSSPGPAFFRQRRIGRDGREFQMIKFRTMAGDPEESGEANATWAASVLDPAAETIEQPEVERRTGVGRMLRRHSIDELPQLFNVLAGDMSLVGPRPELPHYVRMFEERVYRYGDRHRVKSGITGWAQVHGLRGNTSLADRVEWDNWYIANWSLALDFKILLMTLQEVLRSAE